MHIRKVHSNDIRPYTADLAHLRLQVFREFPYLYDGDLAYEARYLSAYANAETSLVVLAVDGDVVVGASTALAMLEADPPFQTAVANSPYDARDTLYFGESVLDRNYRGQGLGKRFFLEREQHARNLGLSITCFCAVERPVHHPLKPAGYRDLREFWIKLGYTHHPELVVHYEWKDINQAQNTSKALSFWFKRIS